MQTWRGFESSSVMFWYFRRNQYSRFSAFLVFVSFCFFNPQTEAVTELKILWDKHTWRMVDSFKEACWMSNRRLSYGRGSDAPSTQHRREAGNCVQTKNGSNFLWKNEVLVLIMSLLIALKLLLAMSLITVTYINSIVAQHMDLWWIHSYHLLPEIVHHITETSACTHIFLNN